MIVNHWTKKMRRQLSLLPGGFNIEVKICRVYLFQFRIENWDGIIHIEFIVLGVGLWFKSRRFETLRIWTPDEGE